MTSVRCVRQIRCGLSYNRLPPNPRGRDLPCGSAKERRLRGARRSGRTGPFQPRILTRAADDGPRLASRSSRTRTESTGIGLGCASESKMRAVGRRSTTMTTRSTRALTRDRAISLKRARPERTDTRRGNVAGTHVLPFSRSSFRDVLAAFDRKIRSPDSVLLSSRLTCFQ